MSGHYGASAADDMGAVRRALPEGGADELNWLFVGTSGVHGTYLTLDDAEAILRAGEARAEEDAWPPRVTVLIVYPRRVWCRYGDVAVTLDDVAWLREQVALTLVAVAESQGVGVPQGAR